MNKVQGILAIVLATGALWVLSPAQAAGTEACQSSYCAASGCFSVEIHNKAQAALSVKPSGKPVRGAGAWAMCTNWLSTEKVMRNPGPLTIGVPQGASLTIVGGMYKMKPFVVNKPGRVVCAKTGFASPISCGAY